MTDLISREAAIAVLKSGFYEQCQKGSVQRILFANAIEALTNMPSAVTLATNEINTLKDALAQAERVTLDDMDDDDLQWWLENKD